METLFWLTIVGENKALGKGGKARCVHSFDWACNLTTTTDLHHIVIPVRSAAEGQINQEPNFATNAPSKQVCLYSLNRSC